MMNLFEVFPNENQYKSMKEKYMEFCLFISYEIIII